MRHIKIFEEFDTNYGYKSMNSDGDIMIDLRKFNNYYRLLFYGDKKIELLKKLFVDKVVGFRGRNRDHFFNDKKVIKDIEIKSYAGPSYTYTFITDDHEKYTVDNDYPITIYTVETDSRKYNL